MKKRNKPGPKPNPPGVNKIPYATRLTPEVVAYLRSCSNAAELIDRQVRRHRGFRELAK